jgi:hypothetical protein
MNLVTTARTITAPRMLDLVTAATRRAGFEPRTDFHSMDFGLRPDIVAYRQRADSLQAARYAEIGALDEARALLIEAWGRDRSAMYLREHLREVNALIWARDSRKAHILHGREKPGRVLEPDDLLP